MIKLSDVINANTRFSRSANIERDHGAHAIDGYIPTGRAIDVIGRLGRGLSDPAAGRTFSLTGPHGSGKSSLAVFLDAMTAPRKSAEHDTAMSLLGETDAEIAEVIHAGLRSVDPLGAGFVRALATADREPVAVTIARALHAGAIRDLGRRQRTVPASFADPVASQRLTSRDILDAIRGVAERRPVILVVDEFGKNLEAYAESGRDGDPYLLQELAEATQGDDPLPLAILTLQHLSFDEYVQDVATSRRREWAKVQGRFQDIPYVETTTQARRLIAATFTRSVSDLDRAWASWRRKQAPAFASAGLSDLLEQSAGAYPLHPLTLAVLPDLCSRYGQNERTLFSFLAGAEPLAVPAFLGASTWTARRPLPFVTLDRVYDYFLDSSATSIGASATASRWLEIESRIRDTTGLTAPQARLLKTIGVLNLVSSAGTLRASRPVLHLAMQGAMPTRTIDEALGGLEAAGLITYRDFADEYRIWQGTDYDLRGAVEIARRTCQDRPLAALLNESAPLDAAVAGRHSQECGVLRVVRRAFSDLNPIDLEPPGPDSPWDGLALYTASPNRWSAPSVPDGSKPVVVVQGDGDDHLRELAVDATALTLALNSAEVGNADWVARRELVERLAAARQRLNQKIAETWAPQTAAWTLLNDGNPVDGRAGVSAALSQAMDRVYTATPRVANEMIARRELTSQGAKARRMLLEAFLTHANEEAFGIDGYGPHRAMYEALFRVTGLHRFVDGVRGIHTPTDRRWRQAWTALNDTLSEATDYRLNLVEAAAVLKAPPYGLKDGIIPVLLIAALTARADDLALYEHGSLVLLLDDAVAERMCRNLGHFTVKNAAASRGPRQAVVAALSDALGIQSRTGTVTFLQAVRAMFGTLRALPPYAQQTKVGVSEEAVAVRSAFKTAGEPDTLLFKTLPAALGLEPFTARGKPDVARAQVFAGRLADALRDLNGAYERLLADIAEHLACATALQPDLPELQAQLSGQAANLTGHVLEPRTRALAAALNRPGLDPEQWLVNAAMVVAEGQAPRVWTDDLAARFTLQVAELGGAWRRTNALLYDNRARDGQPYETRKITITYPDGRETADIVSLTPSETATLDEVLGDAYETLVARFGSEAAARRTLLAWLAIDAETALDGRERDGSAVGIGG